MIEISENIIIDKVVIIGGAAGSVIAYENFLLNKIKVHGFLNNYASNDDWGDIQPILFGKYQEESNQDILNKPGIGYFVATGNNKKREEHIANLRLITKKEPVNCIHPTASVSKFSKIGFGNLIMPNSVINAGSRLGDGIIINSGAIVEHHNIIEDYVQIAPNSALAGYVKVCKGAFIATGASVNPKITIGKNAFVASGAVVTKDVTKDVTVLGIPAKKKI